MRRQTNTIKRLFRDLKRLFRDLKRLFRDLPGRTGVFTPRDPWQKPGHAKRERHGMILGSFSHRSRRLVMTFIESTTTKLVVLLPLLAAIRCGSDAASSDASSGAGGSGGATASTGGAGGDAGATGGSGASNMGGSAGTETGGTGGTGGTAASGGGGGSAGNAGAAGQAGNAGAGGSAGGAVTSTHPTLCIPTATRTVDVSSASELNNALSNAAPGDRIRLADGTYAGGFTLDNDGTATAPIVIVADHLGEARFTGSFTVDADHAVLSSLHFDSATVMVGGDHVRVTRNTFTHGADGTGMTLYYSEGASYGRIDHNEMRDVVSRGISLKYSASDPKVAVHNRVDHNYLHDWVGVHGENTHEGIQLGTHAINGDLDARDALVEYNLLENVSVDGEAICVKSSDNLLRFNTLRSCNARINIRHGRNNEVRNNCTIDSNGIGVHGDDHRIIGNRVEGGTIDIMAGTCTMDTIDQAVAGANHPSARRALVASNTVSDGSIRVGYWFSTGTATEKAEDTKLEANDASITKLFEEGTTQSSTTSESVGQAVCLTPQDVGPNAPDDNCPGEG